VDGGDRRAAPYHIHRESEMTGYFMET